MKLRTKVFDIGKEEYVNLTVLARAMGVSVSEIYRVRKGKRPINERFITGAVKAFPRRSLDDLFYVAQDGSQSDYRE